MAPRLIAVLLSSLVLAAACGSGGTGARDAADSVRDAPDIASPRDAGRDDPAPGDDVDARDDDVDGGVADLGAGSDAADGGVADAADAPDDTGGPGPGFSLYDLAHPGNVRAAWASQDQSLWLVGDGGLVRRFDGVGFVPAPPPPTTRDLFGIAGEGGTIAVVGAAGTVLLFRDGAWTLLDPPTDRDLHGVGILPGGELYIAGDGGLIAHRTIDGAWEVQQPGITADLYAVHASTEGGIHVVGASGAALELKGSQWVQSQIAGPASRMRSIWRAPGGRLFAVGTGGAVAVKDGGSWKLQVTADPYEPPRDLYAVFGFAEDDVWAVGSQGVVLKYNGKKWLADSVEGPYNTTADLRAAGGLPRADGTRLLVAAGLDSRALERGTETWVDRSVGLTNDLLGVRVGEDGRVLAVGSRGLALTYSDGRFGSLATNTLADLTAVSGPWVTGAGGTLLREDAGGLVPVSMPVVEDLADVWERNETAWIVGRTGGLYEATAAGVTERIGLPGVPLEAIAVAGDGTLFVAGGAGRVFAGAPGTLAEVPSGTLSAIHDVWPLPSSGVLAAGDNGVVLSCSRTSCTRVNEDPASFLYGIGGSTGSAVLAVGWAGTVLRRAADGTFAPLSSGTFRVLRAVDGRAGGSHFIVGRDGAFLEYRAMPEVAP